MEHANRSAPSRRGVGWLGLVGLLMGGCGAAQPPHRTYVGAAGAETTADVGGYRSAPATAVEREEPPPVAAGGSVSSAARTLTGIVTRPSPTNTTAPSEPASTEAQPMIIYVADVTMTVERVTETADRAIDIVVRAGGMLASRTDQTVQVRVPSARFRELLAELEHLGEVTHQQIAAEDVSEQFHDLEVQLANLRAMRTRMEDFLHRASNVSEALMVEHELERIAGQIDQIEGRMRFLSARAAYSTITLNLVRREVLIVTPHPQPDNQPALPFSWLDSLGLPRLTQLR